MCSAVKLFTDALSIFEANYPEALHCAYFINGTSSISNNDFTII